MRWKFQRRRTVSKYQDKLNEFAENVLKAVENNSAPWQKPWEAGKLLELPKNFNTGKEYQGANLINLALSGYNDPRWMTFNQAVNKGYKIRRGEKSSTVFFFSPTRLEKDLDESGKPKLDDNGKELMKEVERPVFKTFNVFNATQIEGLEPYNHPEPNWNVEEKAEKLIEAAPVKIIESQLDAAYYRPSSHTIETPPKSNFVSESEYYSTIFHEIAHATQNTSMLGREPGENRGKEELRAEIAAWLTCTQLGVGYKPSAEENNKRYVASWLKSINEKDRPKELALAIKDAEKIADYMFGLDQEKSIKKDVSFQVKGTLQGKDSSIPIAILEDGNIDFISQDGVSLGNKIQTFPTRNEAQKAILVAGTNNKNFATLIEAGDKVELDIIEVDPPAKEVNQERLYLNVPFSEKDQAKKLGAKWDSKKKSWFISPDKEKELFAKWFDSSTPEKKEYKTVDLEEVKAQFIAAAAEVGLKIEDPVLDGKLHRVPVEGDRGSKKSGTYVVFPDGRPAGFIQNHKSGVKTNFKYDGEIDKSQFKYVPQIDKTKERNAAYEKAAKTAFGIYINADKTTSHPYLESKGINGGSEYRIDKSNRLIIPAINLKTNKIESLQFISEDGDKQFLAGGKKTGNCFIVGKLDETKPVLLAEGLATAKTLHDISHLPAVVCFDAGNLENVAKQIKEIMPNAELFICADNDHTLENNVGIEKAEKAAEAVGATVIIPRFTEESKRRGCTDFNDLHKKCKLGEKRVADQLKAKIPYLSKQKDMGEGLGL